MFSSVVISKYSWFLPKTVVRSIGLNLEARLKLSKPKKNSTSLQVITVDLMNNITRHYKNGTLDKMKEKRLDAENKYDSVEFLLSKVKYAY